MSALRRDTPNEVDAPLGSATATHARDLDALQLDALQLDALRLDALRSKLQLAFWAWGRLLRLVAGTVAVVWLIVAGINGDSPIDSLLRLLP